MQLIIGGILLGILAWVGFTIAPFIFSFLGNLLALAGIAIVGLFAGFIGLIEAGIENWDRVLILIASLTGTALLIWLILWRISLLNERNRIIARIILFSIPFAVIPAIFVIFLFGLIIESWFDMYEPFFISLSIFLVYWSLVTYYQCKESLENKSNTKVAYNLEQAFEDDKDISVFVFHNASLLLGIVLLAIVGGIVVFITEKLQIHIWREIRMFAVIISFFIPFYILYKRRNKN